MNFLRKIALFNVPRKHVNVLYHSNFTNKGYMILRSRILKTRFSKKKIRSHEYFFCLWMDSFNIVVCFHTIFLLQLPGFTLFVTIFVFLIEWNAGKLQQMREMWENWQKMSRSSRLPRARSGIP